MKKINYYQILCKITAINILLSSFIAAANDNNLVNQQLILNAEQFIIAQLSESTVGQIQIEGMPIDDRIVVPECLNEIEFSVNPDTLFQSNIAVKAECPNSSWYMYLMLRATEIQPVVVVSSAISPGTLLSKDNLLIIDMDKKRLKMTTFADIESVVGARLKRRLISGRPIEPKDLCFVCKGDKVVISAESSLMQIKTNGIALEDGNIGDTIVVENSRSKRNLTAQIINTHEVKVNL